MKHEIVIRDFPTRFTADEDMLSFSFVEQEKMTLLKKGILTPSTVGIRMAGYFRCRGEGSEVQARAALRYALQTARFHLSSPTEIDFPPLFTERRTQLLAEANAALEQAESPFRLDEVVFGWLDYCVHDGRLGSSSQRYSGFVIGQSAARQVTVHKPKGVPGEWQCVCGAYSTPGEVCAECSIPRPGIFAPAGYPDASER